MSHNIEKLHHNGIVKVTPISVSPRFFPCKNLVIMIEWIKHAERICSMDTRVALISIILKDTDAAEALNNILHDYGVYIIGRMGIPYREKGIQIISIAIDAPADVINALSGKIGRLKGVTSKVAYAGE